MKTSFHFRLVIAVSLLAGCNGESKHAERPSSDSPGVSHAPVPSSRFIYSFADSVLEQRIIDTLMTLGFVKNSNRFIDSLSQHQHGISFLPDTTGGKISVSAGYNRVDRFEPYYNFIIDKKTFEIKVLEPTTGDYISVEEFIKKNPGQ
jgi:hypothetical protein